MLFITVPWPSRSIWRPAACQYKAQRLFRWLRLFFRLAGVVALLAVTLASWRGFGWLGV